MALLIKFYSVQRQTILLVNREPLGTEKVKDSVLKWLEYQISLNRYFKTCQFVSKTLRLQLTWPLINEADKQRFDNVIEFKYIKDSVKKESDRHLGSEKDVILIIVVLSF